MGRPALIVEIAAKNLATGETYETLLRLEPGEYMEAAAAETTGLTTHFLQSERHPRRRCLAPTLLGPGRAHLMRAWPRCLHPLQPPLRRGWRTPGVLQAWAHARSVPWLAAGMLCGHSMAGFSGRWQPPHRMRLRC